MRWGRAVLAIALAGLFCVCPVALGAQGGTDITGTIPLAATGITASSVTSTGATILWETNSSTSSQVFYDIAAHDNGSDYAQVTTIDTELVSTHSVVLTGLTASTTYHFRVQSHIPDTAFTVVSEDITFVTTGTSGGGGGGSGGGGFGSQMIGINLSGTSPFMDGNGKSITAGQISTPDGQATLTIPIGVYIWNAAGAAQPFLSAAVLTDPPQAPPQNSLVMAYEMGPGGVTFNPAISLTFNYADRDIPAGTREADLYIAWWDGTAWVKLIGTVDPTANTVTAQVTHFTSFALIASAAAPVVAPTLKIASPSTGTSFDSGNVTVSIIATNISLLADNRPNASGEGRVIYYIDVPIPTTAGVSAFSAAGTYKESESNGNIWANLAPGTHILGVQLVQNDHTPFNPPVFATVSVIVKEAVIVPPTTTAPTPTDQSPLPPTAPSPNPTKTNWAIPILFLVAAGALGGFLYWRSRKPEAKLKYTNR